MIAGVLSLGIGITPVLAQNGYYRVAPNPGVNPYGGYNSPAMPYGAGYGNTPVPPNLPYGGGYNPQPGPYPGGYGVNPPAPVNPYGGGYPANPPASFPGGYGAYPNSPVGPYGPGGDRRYQSNYSPPASPPPGNFEAYPAPPAILYPGPSPVVAMADQLIQQADGFLQAFAPTAGVVPEGQQFLTEASALRDAAARFRQVAASGANPANEFAAVAALYQRLEARMARVSRGNIGPNIRNALQMGSTIQQIRSSLP